MYLFWLVIVLIGITSHFARFPAKRQHNWKRIPENEIDAQEASTERRQNVFRQPYTLLKQFVTVPATFGYTRSQNLGWWATIPTRAQSIAILAFTALNIYFCSVDYRLVERNL